MQAVLHALLLSMAFGIIHIIPQSAVKIVLVLTMLVSGFLRSLSIVPKLLFLSNSNSDQDQLALSVWYSLAFLGDLVSLELVGELMKAGVQ